MPGPSGTLVLGAGGEGLGTVPHVGTEAGSPGGGCPPAQVGASCLSHLPLLSLVGGVHHRQPSQEGEMVEGKWSVMGRGPLLLVLEGRAPAQLGLTGHSPFIWEGDNE